MDRSGSEEGAEETSGRAPIKVLLADDDEDQRFLLGRVLQRGGCAVVPVAAGTDVVAAARAERPDVILLDVQMPDQDGFTTGRQLKADPDPTLAAIPIVFLSGRTDTQAMLEAARIGAAYLSKSSDYEDVVRTVQALAQPPR